MEVLWLFAIVLFGLLMAAAAGSWSLWKRRIVRERSARGEPRHTQPPDVPLAGQPRQRDARR